MLHVKVHENYTYDKILSIQKKVEIMTYRMMYSKSKNYLYRDAQLRLSGHICRMNDNRLIKQTIFAKIDGKPRRARPFREWLDDIKDWCGRSGQDLLQLVQDRRM